MVEIILDLFIFNLNVVYMHYVAKLRSYSELQHKEDQVVKTIRNNKYGNIYFIQVGYFLWKYNDLLQHQRSSWPYLDLYSSPSH